MPNHTTPDQAEIIAEPLPIDYRRIEVVDPQMAEILRGKTVTQRLAIVQSAHVAAQRLVAMGVKLQHPDWSAGEVSREVAMRMLNGAN